MGTARLGVGRSQNLGDLPRPWLRWDRPASATVPPGRGMLPEGRDPAWRRAGTAGGSPALRATSQPAQRDGTPLLRLWVIVKASAGAVRGVCVQTGCDQGLGTGIRDGVEVLTTHCGFADEPSSQRTRVDACPWRTGALHRHLHVCVGLLAGLSDL